MMGIIFHLLINFTDAAAAAFVYACNLKHRRCCFEGGGGGGGTKREILIMHRGQGFFRVIRARRLLLTCDLYTPHAILQAFPTFFI